MHNHCSSTQHMHADSLCQNVDATILGTGLFMKNIPNAWPRYAIRSLHQPRILLHLATGPSKSSPLQHQKPVALTPGRMQSSWKRFAFRLQRKLTPVQQDAIHDIATQKPDCCNTKPHLCKAHWIEPELGSSVLDAWQQVSWQLLLALIHRTAPQ